MRWFEPDPQGVALAAWPIADAQVARCLRMACQRLGVPLPLTGPRPTVKHVPRLQTLLPGHEEGTYSGQAVVFVERPTDALIRHGLGHWLFERGQLPEAIDRQRSEAWARLAEGRPLARFLAWWRGGPA